MAKGIDPKFVHYGIAKMTLQRLKPSAKPKVLILIG